jgi:hypothetical protein
LSSLNEFVTDVDCRLAVPTELYGEHLLPDAGVAPFWWWSLPYVLSYAAALQRR